MKTKVLLAILFSVCALAFSKQGVAENSKSDDVVVIVTDYSYLINPGDTKETIEKLALFGAHRKAVGLAGKYLSHKGLLPDYGNRQKEIYCLAADEISARSIESKELKSTNTYYVKVKATVKSIDFLRAEIKDLQLEKKEMGFTWQEELGQYTYMSVKPAQELSRAYRYIRRHYWRIAVIYLNHLEKKYPNWAEMYHVKAISLFAENKMEAMMDSLQTACSLGDQEACGDRESLLHHEKALTIE